jgi:hypothetical protein
MAQIMNENMFAFLIGSFKSLRQVSEFINGDFFLTEKWSIRKVLQHYIQIGPFSLKRQTIRQVISHIQSFLF